MRRPTPLAPSPQNVRTNDSFTTIAGGRHWRGRRRPRESARSLQPDAHGAEISRRTPSATARPDPCRRARQRALDLEEVAGMAAGQRRARDQPGRVDAGQRRCAPLEIVPERHPLLLFRPRALGQRNRGDAARGRIGSRDRRCGTRSNALTSSVPQTSRIAASANSPATRNHSVRRPRGAPVVPLVVAFTAERRSPPTACSAGAHPNRITVPTTISDGECDDARDPG